MKLNCTQHYNLSCFNLGTCVRETNKTHLKLEIQILTREMNKSQNEMTLELIEVLGNTEEKTKSNQK